MRKHRTKKALGAYLKTEAAKTLGIKRGDIENFFIKDRPDKKVRFAYGLTNVGFFKIAIERKDTKINRQLRRESLSQELALDLGIPTLKILKHYTLTASGHGILYLERLNLKNGILMEGKDGVRNAPPEIGARVAKVIDLVSGIEISKNSDPKEIRFLKRTDKRSKSPEVYWKFRKYNIRRVLAKKQRPWRNKLIEENKLRRIIQDSEELFSPYVDQDDDPSTEYFIHNDMSTQNVFVPNPPDSPDGQVLFLDFEHSGATSNRTLARLTDFNNFYGRCWPNPEMQRQFITTYLRESKVEDIKYRYALMKETAVFGTIFLSRFGMNKDHPEHDMSITLLRSLERNLEVLGKQYSLLKN